MDLIELKQKLPLITLMEQYGFTPAKTSGDTAFFVCMFHEDKNPSLTVNTQTGMAGCFAPHCPARFLNQEKFIQLADHLTKEEAIDKMYELAGESRPMDDLHGTLARVLDRLTVNMNEQTPKLFFENRGIGPMILKKFKVGYSPSYEWFRSQIQDIPQDIASKLEFFRTDMFDGAIIHPLFNNLGQVSGFQSRPMVSSFSKYINNNKDFPLHPSRIYGQHFVKGSQIVLVEGVNDVLAWHQHMPIVGGMMGSNLRDIDKQLTSLGFADIVFIGDGDEAGRLACMKAPDLVRVNHIPFEHPNNLDPDEYAKTNGLMGIAKLIEESRYPFDVLLESRLRNIPTSLTGKVMLVKNLAADISEGLNPIIIRKMRNKIADALEIHVDEVDSIFDLAEFDTTLLEQKIVSHLYDKGELAEDIKSKVILKMFGDPRTRKAYQEMLDGLSPTEAVQKMDGLTMGDVEYFIELSRRRELKKMLKLSSATMSNLNLPLEEVLNKTMAKVSATTSENMKVLSGLELAQGFSEYMSRPSTGGLPGISFGPAFPYLDQLTGGLMPNTINLLGANTGVGKSMLGLIWAASMAVERKIPTLWISLEMTEESMERRLIGQIAHVNAKDIKWRTVTDDDRKALADAAMKVAQSPIHICFRGGATVHEIVALIRKYKALHDIKVVFIDYLGLLKGAPKEESGSLYQSGGYASQQLKQAIAQDSSLGISLVLLVQLNKQGLRGDTPTSDTIAESSKIPQDADLAILLRRLTEADILANSKKNLAYGNMVAKITKSRDDEDQKSIGLIVNYKDITIKEVGNQAKENRYTAAPIA